MNRMLRVARIQLFNAPMVLGLPVLVLALVLLANIVIFGAVGESAPPDDRVTGALMSIYIVMLIAHVQTMTQVFSFTVGLSVTRRTFFGATALVIVGQSLAYGVLLYLLRLAEQVTGGWGLDLTFFALPFTTQNNPLFQILVYTVPFLFVSFIGVWVGIVFQRWGQPGIWALGIAVGVLVMALVALVTWQQWWPTVGQFFEKQPTLALFAGYPLVLAAVLAAAGYLTTRRAVP